MFEGDGPSEGMFCWQFRTPLGVAEADLVREAEVREALDIKDVFGVAEELAEDDRDEVPLVSEGTVRRVDGRVAVVERRHADWAWPS
jgi:hypothetical protein